MASSPRIRDITVAPDKNDYQRLVGLLNGDEPDVVSTGSPVPAFGAPVRLTNFDGVDNDGTSIIEPLTSGQAYSLIVRAKHGNHLLILGSAGRVVLNANDQGLSMDNIPSGGYGIKLATNAFANATSVGLDTSAAGAGIALKMAVGQKINQGANPLLAADADNVTRLYPGSSGIVEIPSGTLRILTGGLFVTVGNATIGGTLSAGATTLASLHDTGTLAVDGNATIGDSGTDTHIFNGNTTFNQDVVVVGTLTAGSISVTNLHLPGDLTVDGNTILGNASSDTLVVNATPTFATRILLSAAASQVRPGATSLAFLNNAATQTNLLINDAGDVTVRNGFTVSAGTTTVGALTAGAVTATTVGTSGGVTVGGNLVVTGTTNSGAITTTTIGTSGGVTVGGNLVTGGSGTFGSTLNALATTITGNLIVQTSGPAQVLKADVASNVVRVGAGTAPGVSGENLTVVDGPIVAGYNNDGALYFKRTSSSGAWAIGSSASGANPDLLFKDDSGTEMFRVGDASAAYQAKVTGNFWATGDVLMNGGTLTIAQLAHNGTLYGWFGTPPQARVTITGSRSGGVALTNLLTKLANIGFIIDSSTA